VELLDAEGQRLALVQNTNDDRLTEHSLDFGHHYLRVFWAGQQAGSYPLSYHLHASMDGCQ